MPEPKKLSIKKKQNVMFAVAWGVIIVIAIGYGLYRNAYIPKNVASKQADISQITDEGVTWLAEPQEVTIQEELFSPDWIFTSDQKDASPIEKPIVDQEKIKIRYYKVGSDNGKDIIIAILPAVDPNGDRHIMLLKDGEKYHIVRAYSNDVYYNNNNTTYSGPVFNGDWVVEDFAIHTYHAIEYPNPIVLPQGILKHIQVYGAKYFFKDYAQTDPAYPEHLEKITTTPWGDLYSHTREEKDSAGTVVTIQDFIVKLASGVADSFQATLQFVQDDNVPLLTWNDGTKNKDVYAWNSLGGCGASGSVAVANPAIMKELASAGKTVTGETIYEFTDMQNPVLKKYYEQLPNGTYYFYDSATGESKQIPISLEEYAKNHGVFIYKDGFGRYIIFLNQRFGTGAECGKPVIYLYPKTTTNVSVAVGANVTKSDPEYVHGWNVVAHPDGSIVNADSKLYSSLFWEGTGNGTYPLIESGFVVAQEKLEATLWSHLSKLGLDDREAKDFMEFWLPRMPSTPYVRLTWLGTRQMNELAPLTITPKPDTTVRIFLDFEGLEKQITLHPQALSAPVRNGFTVVEWGGLLQKGK